jgi:hypothetical protein
LSSSSIEGRMCRGHGRQCVGRAGTTRVDTALHAWQVVSAKGKGACEDVHMHHAIIQRHSVACGLWHIHLPGVARRRPVHMRPCTATPDLEKEAFLPLRSPNDPGLINLGRQRALATEVWCSPSWIGASFGRGIGAGGASSRRRHAAMGDP